MVILMVQVISYRPCNDNNEAVQILYPIGREEFGPGVCRLINTSSSDCWDGSMVAEEDIDEFKGTTITDQGIHVCPPLLFLYIQ